MVSRPKEPPMSEPKLFYRLACHGTASIRIIPA
jgi:hypothetical protein